MKKLFFAFALFLLCSTAYSQYESVPLRLVTAEGLPHTGQAANITFRRSPFGGGDVISGLTVTETGTAGNYIVNGFTTFEKAKFFFSGVEQTWWGGTNGLYVGDIVPWITSLLTTQLGNYILKVGSVTGISGNKTISSGDWLKLDGTETWNKPYIFSGSPWVTDYSAWSNNGLISRAFGDSIYGEKKWWINGFKMRLLPGYKWVGYNNTTPPIPVNINEITYDETIGLGVGSTQDSTAFHEAVTVYYDSTDASENNYRKTFTDVIPNYKNPIWDSLGSKGKYQRITNGTVVSELEYYNVNNGYFKELEDLRALTTSPAIMDTLTLPRPGLYMITSVFTVNFVDFNGASTDSITVELDDGSLPGSSRLATQTVTHRYESLVTSGGAMTVTVTCLFYRQGTNNPVYLMAHNHQTGSSLIHEVWKTQTTAINIY
ncbi:MAG: hypothetical protein HOP31_08805 [Ignavibacteria bacterium]|nr:hypothetical protein [Ignavibacteria bacterium]